MNRTLKNITEHGISMYRQRHCRCDICKAAATAERLKYRPKKNPVSIRLDGTRFVERLLRDNRHGAINTNLISKWQRFGIDLYAADRWCVRLGYHPIEIWGNDFYRNTEEELVDA